MLLSTEGDQKPEIPEFELSCFSSNFNAFFWEQNDDLYGLLVDQKKMQFYLKGSNGGSNSEILYIWKVFCYVLDQGLYVVFNIEFLSSVMVFELNLIAVKLTVEENIYQLAIRK